MSAVTSPLNSWFREDGANSPHSSRNSGFKGLGFMPRLDIQKNQKKELSGSGSGIGNRFRVAKTFLKKSVQKSVHFQKIPTIRTFFEKKICTIHSIFEKNPYNPYN